MIAPLLQEAQQLLRLGRNGEAMNRLRQVLSMDPSSLPALKAMAQLLLQSGRAQEAIPFLKKAAALDPDPVAATVQLAQALIEGNEFGEAESTLRRGLESAPEDGYLRELLGGVLKQTGRFEEALQELARAMRTQPARTSLALDYVSCRKMTEADRPVLSPMFGATGASAEERIALEFAIAKFNDDLGEYGMAIEHFDRAHELASMELRRKGRSYNAAQMESRIDAIIHAFTRERLSKHVPASSPSTRPVFIFGMVRSGTTLVEQIVTRHSQVASGGELPFWPQNWQKAGSDQTLGEAYLAALERIDSSAPMVTDKMPGNYIALGSILSVFPNAKLIYCRRKPIDNCVSIYTTPFRSGHEWIHRREDIVSFYRLHEKLMDHWRAVLPASRMLEVQYERLVAEPEETAKAIVDYLGLRWEEACLRPEENERPVRTPSQWQVRQPVFRSSVDRWRNYEPWLGAFAQLLSEGEK